MPPHLWTHDFMDALRGETDPLADGVIEQLFREGKQDGINGLMRSLVHNGDTASARLPSYVGEYLAWTEAEVAWLDPARLANAQALFELYTPEVMMVLGYYSLPASYAARKGVQVLHRTGVLQKQPIRRLLETAQMVADVMTEGGLSPGGKGVRTTQKVRLMHAAVRHMIRHDRRQPWDAAELGQPINQEDLAGTLMTFAYVVLEGLKALRVELTLAQQEDWVYAWSGVGRLLGVDERLLPADLEQARQLTLFIRERQVAYSPEGVALTAALIQGMQELTPDFLDGFSASMVHFFLDQDQWRGVNVAELLRVPAPDWTAVVPHVIKAVGELVGDLVGGDHHGLMAKLLRELSTQVFDALMRVEYGGHRPTFGLPAHLRRQQGGRDRKAA